MGKEPPKKRRKIDTTDDAAAKGGATAQTQTDDYNDIDLTDENLLYIGENDDKKVPVKLARPSDFTKWSEQQVKELTQAHTRNIRHFRTPQIALLPLGLKNPGAFFTKELATPGPERAAEIIQKCKSRQAAKTPKQTVIDTSKKKDLQKINERFLEKNHTYVVNVESEEETSTYTYKTDAYGRVNFVTGKLIGASNGSKEYRGDMQGESVEKKGGTATLDGLFRNCDNGGHIFAAEFCGPDALINYFPQHEVSNQHGQWKKLENEMNSYVKDSKAHPTRDPDTSDRYYEVTLNVIFYYPEKQKDASEEVLRPTVLEAMYSVKDLRTGKVIKERPAEIENPKPVLETDVNHGSHFRIVPLSTKEKKSLKRKRRDGDGDDYNPGKD